jgi:hypothetical protein
LLIYRYRYIDIETMGQGGSLLPGSAPAAASAPSAAAVRAYEEMARGRGPAAFGPPATPLGARVAEAMLTRTTPAVRSAAGLQAAARELLHAPSRAQAAWLVETAYAGDVWTLAADLLASVPRILAADAGGARAEEDGDGRAEVAGAMAAGQGAETRVAAADWLLACLPLAVGASLVPLLRAYVLGEAPAPVWRNPLRDVPAGAAGGLLMRPAVATALSLGVENPLQAWTLLYSSRRHGTSFSRFVHAVRGYSGAAIVLVEEKPVADPGDASGGEAGALFGAYVAGGWKDQLGHFGSSRCYLFRILPTFSVYRASGVGHAFVYLNSAATQMYPTGLGFGGELRAPRLWLEPSFGRGRSSAVDTTYDRGLLSVRPDFDVAAVEVWGCGGSVAEEALRAARVEEARYQESRRTVDRTKFAENWAEGPDKWMMDLVGRTGHSNAYAEDFAPPRPGSSASSSSSSSISSSSSASASASGPAGGSS